MELFDEDLQNSKQINELKSDYEVFLIIYLFIYKVQIRMPDFEPHFNCGANGTTQFPERRSKLRSSACKSNTLITEPPTS